MIANCSSRRLVGTQQPVGLWWSRPCCLQPCRAAPTDADKFAAAKLIYTEKDYMEQAQSAARAAWSADVRQVTGKRDHLFWEPSLDPPALLADVVVVLVSPRRPVSVGTVARSCSCFETESIRIVQPRCDHLTRHSKSASKGSQYLLYRAQVANSIQDATRDCDLRVAFTRWTQGLGVPFYDLPALPQHPVIQSLITAPAPCSSVSTGQPAASDTQQQQQDAAGATRTRIALIFGREELGLSDDEVKACDCACSIPIGRLQESISLSHAVSLALSTIFQPRMMHMASTSSSVQVMTPADLAAGYDSSEGTER